MGALSRIPCRAGNRSDPSDDSGFEATAPGPWGFKTNDGLISVHEKLHLFREYVFGSVVQDIQRDIRNA
jgi:hypothetical protein